MTVEEIVARWQECQRGLREAMATERRLTLAIRAAGEEARSFKAQSEAWRTLLRELHGQEVPTDTP